MIYNLKIFLNVKIFARLEQRIFFPEPFGKRLPIQCPIMNTLVRNSYKLGHPPA